MNVAPTETMTSPGACRIGSYGAIATLLGTVVSGPVAQLVVAMTHPQPAWAGARLFADRYHPVQTLPFFCGLILVTGFVVLVASLHALAPDRQRALTTCGLAFACIFASLVFLNYVVQTTFLPELARHDVEANAALIGALTMSNPRSLGWGLEMWGYGFLGVATWLVSPVFSGSRLERWARWAFIANGPISIAGALWTAASPGWVMSAPGLIAFASWNILVVVMAALALAVFRRRSGLESVSGLAPCP